MMKTYEIRRDILNIPSSYKKLLKEDLIHIIGTDAHSSSHRRPKIKKCLRYIEKKAGASRRQKLTERNPAKIIRGENICG